MTTQWNPEAHYQDTAIASSYDAERFCSFSGRRGDRKEKNAYTRLLDQIGTTDRVLDVPCGTGRITELLLQRGQQVTGCDISPQMLKQAGLKLSTFGDKVNLLPGDIKHLPFEDGSFDLVSCVRLFGHFPSADRIVTLRELSRVSSRWVLIQYFFETSLTRLKRRIKRHLLRTYPGVNYPVVAKQLDQEIKDAGLTERSRAWCRRYYSEEVFLLLEKQQTNGEIEGVRH